MISFYIANSIEEVENNNKFLNFDEEIHFYLQRNKENYPINLNYLTELKAYGEVDTFNSEQIYELIEVCDSMVQYTWGKEINLNIFFLDLLKFCENAISLNKSILAIGD